MALIAVRELAGVEDQVGVARYSTNPGFLIQHLCPQVFVGSSMTITFGFCRISLPNINRCCSPPDTTFTDFSLSSLENNILPSVARNSCSSVLGGCHCVIQSNKIISSSNSAAISGLASLRGVSGEAVPAKGVGFDFLRVEVTLLATGNRLLWPAHTASVLGHE